MAEAGEAGKAWQGREGNKGRDCNLVVDALLKGMLVRPEAAVCGRHLVLQPGWRELIQPHGKLGHVVPARCSHQVLLAVALIRV